jgi:XTP/dITP diphosphohydrolase
MIRKLLIATSNEGKFKEMKEFFHTQHFFDIVSLKDVGITDIPEEPFDTVELNAYAKARFYGDKSQLLTLADDGGLFIEALNGWPGVQAARIAQTDEARADLVLEKLKGTQDRKASVKGAWVVYDPIEQTYFTSTASVDIEIAQSPVGEHGFGYDPIFFYPPMQKTFAQMSAQEKNEISHRGKGLTKLEYHFKKQYGARNIVVPCALIIQGGKLLMQKRNDPQRPDYHGKWEFPGGGVEFKEKILENVVREVKEETGLVVEPIKLLQHIAVEWQEYPTFSYQVYLIPYVCKVIGGNLTPRDHEVLEAKWFELDEVLNYPLVGENANMYAQLQKELKEVLTHNNL